METVTSTQQYKELVKQAKERFGRLDTNCMTGSKGMDAAIQRGLLLYEAVPGGVLFYADEGMYLRLYYHLGKNAPFPKIDAPKTVLLEEPDNGERRKAYLDDLFARAEKEGFEKVAVNLMVSSNPAAETDTIAEEYRNACGRIAAGGLAVTECRPEMRETVLALWRDYLKLSDVPDDHLHFESDPSQKVVCAVDREGNVKGVNWWQIRGKNCEIRHTVTAPDSYKKGIGYTLVMAALNDAAARGCGNAYTYISDVNNRSLAMYAKAGMPANGKVSYQYMLPPAINHR